MGIIESAPLGIGPPVMILSASPFSIHGCSCVPAFDTPTMVNFAGAFRVSACNTANPSIDELSNPGSSTCAITLLANTLLSALLIEIVSVDSFI